MPVSSPLKTLRKNLYLTQLEMSELLGLSMTLYSMAEGGHRALPGGALIRVLEITNLLNEWTPEGTTDPSAILSELQSLAEATALNLKKRGQKQTESDATVHARQRLAFLLSHFDRLTDIDVDLKLEQVWKAALEVKTIESNPTKTLFQSIENRIEMDCLAYKMRRIQEEMEAIRNPS